MSRLPYYFKLLLIVFIIFGYAQSCNVSYANTIDATVIGRVESLFEHRISLRVLEIVDYSTEEAPLVVNNWISFDLPKDARSARRRRDRINFGNVIKVDISGSIITEYEETDSAGIGENVVFWTANNATRVSNESDYIPESERSDSRSRRRRRRRDRRREEQPQEPDKIWVQEETVRGLVNVRQERVYIKEDHMGRRDRGLLVLSEPWIERLENLEDHRIVVHGTTNRVSASSGTLEIDNLMRIYPR